MGTRQGQRQRWDAAWRLARQLWWQFTEDPMHNCYIAADVRTVGGDVDLAFSCLRERETPDLFTERGSPLEAQSNRRNSLVCCIFGPIVYRGVELPYKATEATP